MIRELIPVPAPMIHAGTGALWLSTDQFLMPMGFIPESKFQSVPESKFVIDGPQIVFDDVLRSPHNNCHLAIVESLRDKFDHLLLSFIGIKRLVSAIRAHKFLRDHKVTKLDSLDPVDDPKPQIEPAEMSFHCAWRYVEVFADFCVVTSQK